MTSRLQWAAGEPTNMCRPPLEANDLRTALLAGGGAFDEVRRDVSHVRIEPAAERAVFVAAAAAAAAVLCV